MRATTEAWIDRLRATCLALPNVVESGGIASGVGQLSGTGVVTFTVSRRVVARLFVLDPGGREQVVLWLRAASEEREALIQSGHPFFRAGPREVGVVIDEATDWTEIAELVIESYVLIAPKRLAAQVRESGPNP